MDLAISYSLQWSHPPRGNQEKLLNTRSSHRGEL